MKRAARTRKPKPKAAEASDDAEAMPTTWRSYDRRTGGFKKLLIVEMPNDHLLAAIAYCERRAADYTHMTNLSLQETARQLWPGYVALVAESTKRFGPPSARSAPATAAARAIILPDTEKEDA
jgi:hypothetical protein